MKHISINVTDAIKNYLPETIEKCLTDNEIICPTCNGLGVTKRIYPFAVKDEFSIKTKYDWYESQYLIPCPSCYYGVVKTCKFCGKQLQRSSLRCDCQGYKEDEKRRESEKRKERISMAYETTPDRVSTYLYDDENDMYYAEIEDFVDVIKEDYLDDKYACDSFDEFFDKVVPKVLWVTEYVEMSMDAQSIVENACEELHEDAMDNVSGEDLDELQKYLDSWCKSQTGTETYYPCYIKYVKVQKEWFNEEL